MEPEIQPQSNEQFTPTPSKLAEARGDLRVMACVRAAYEAYAVQCTREGKEVPSWQALLERPAEVRCWIAAVLATTSARSAGSSGVYESAAAGTGRNAKLGATTRTRRLKPLDLET